MNRDENIARGSEISPKIYNSSIYPKDSKANGTWIAVNKNGIIFALMNSYEKTNITPKISRGTIIPLLSETKNIESSIDKLKTIIDENYAPFTLILCDKKNIKKVHWNGDNINYHNHSKQQWQYFTSSSWNEDGVFEYRKEKFNKWLVNKNFDENGIPTFHKECDKGMEQYCVLVKRKTVETVSITQIEIDDANKIRLSYLNLKEKTPLQNYYL
jgi:uncharacterized protein with NRDE domain